MLVNDVYYCQDITITVVLWCLEQGHYNTTPEAIWGLRHYSTVPVWPTIFKQNAFQDGNFVKNHSSVSPSVLWVTPVRFCVDGFSANLTSCRTNVPLWILTYPFFECCHCQQFIFKFTLSFLHHDSKHKFLSIKVFSTKMLSKMATSSRTRTRCPPHV